MEETKEKYKKRLNQALTKNNRETIDFSQHTLVVFGAGNTSRLYAKCFERENIKPEFYVDNAKEKQGTIFQGVNVISPDELLDLVNPFVLISSANRSMVNQIKEQLNAMKIPCLHSDAYVFSKNKEKLFQVIDLLEDDYSIEVYCHLLVSRMNNQEIAEEFICDHRYFAVPAFKKINNFEVFVDMGAFVGEGIEDYLFYKLGTFKKIYAFEPDTRNFQAMNYRLERLVKEWALTSDQIVCINAGVGRETAQLKFSVTETHSNSLGAYFVEEKTEDDNGTKIYSLDDYFNDSDEKLSFLKADIESYELEMLIGAKNIIEKNLPLIAVCIYHNASDMFEIALFIKSLSSKYKFSIRHHYGDYAETVLYAWTD